MLKCMKMHSVSSVLMQHMQDNFSGYSFLEFPICVFLQTQIWKEELCSKSGQDSGQMRMRDIETENQTERRIIGSR